MFDQMLTKEEIDYYKENFPAGTRIELISMDDPFTTIPRGTRGTVRIIDDIATLHTDFDNGRRLGIIPGVDTFRKLTVKELEEERTAKSLNNIIEAADNKLINHDCKSSNKTQIAEKDR